MIAARRPDYEERARRKAAGTRRGNVATAASVLDAARISATIVTDRPREAPLTTSPLPLSRLLVATAIVAAPTGFSLVVLVAVNALSARAALLSLIGVSLFILILLRPLLRSFIALREAIALATNHEDATPSMAGHNPLVGELWRAVNRLTRASRQRLADIRAELAATQAVLAALPDPMILLDERRRVVRANAAAIDLFGGEFIDRDLASTLRHPAVLAAADAVLRGEGERIVEFALGLPVERQLSARIAPLGAHVAAGAVIVTLHDLTASKRSEQMRADFVANASHELRTPLATLLGFIETLRGPARDDREAQDRFLAIMHDQASRMARLIDDLLSLSRIEMNEHVLPTGRANLHHLLGSVAATLELRAKARGMRIVLDLADELPEAVGEADELAQVFQNLFDNAIKYGHEGSAIEVSARVERRRAGPPLIAIAVRDHGEGIRREHLPRLTERFYRVDTARSRAMGGTGLGLAIVKHIVNRHRGRLDIASEMGKGSVFTVSLRLAGDDADAR
jgi:two-component system, OmpR family, phosphate regulon sensor histidine kinase PhoR